MKGRRKQWVKDITWSRRNGWIKICVWSRGDVGGRRAGRNAITLLALAGTLYQGEWDMRLLNLHTIVSCQLEVPSILSSIKYTPVGLGRIRNWGAEVLVAVTWTRFTNCLGLKVISFKKLQCRGTWDEPGISHSTKVNQPNTKIQRLMLNCGLLGYEAVNFQLLIKTSRRICFHHFRRYNKQRHKQQVQNLT